MSQNSLTIGNVTASAARTAINNAFDTLKTLHSGASAPSSPSAYMLWFETDTNKLQIYDGAQWIVIGEMDATNNNFHPIIGNWKLDLSGNDLTFEYNGAAKAKLSSTGTFTVVGDVVAFGTI
jgi:hypothetical protein